MAIDGPYVLLKDTTDAAGTTVATPVKLTKAGRVWMFQTNDSAGTTTFNLYGSLDGVNYQLIKTVSGGTVTHVPDIVFVDFVYVTWSGNTGTVSVLASHD